MQEKILSTQLLSPKEIAKAVELLRIGQLVAFPTETVYGLGALLDNPIAIQKIFQVKGRPKDNPLIVHIHSLEEVEKIAIDIPNEFYLLAEAFFPGPLTLVLEANPNVPPEASAHLPTIAVRCPSHPVARDLLKNLGSPLVAPSANLSGRPSATSAEHVLEDFQGKIAAVIDGGKCSLGVESTVIGLQSVNYPMLLRPGTITRKEIESILKRPLCLPNRLTPILSPGMRYRHYAPNATVKLFFSKEALFEHILKDRNIKRMILSEENFQEMACEQYPLENASLYAFLRYSDKIECDEVLILCNETVQKNEALMNRLYRASECP